MARKRPLRDASPPAAANLPVRILDQFHSRPDERSLFLVDDEETDRLVFQRLVRDTAVPNPCRVFTHGEALIDALIEVLRGAPPPLACFVDVKMDGMSGFDVLRWIRCQHTLDEIPVVMLSSSEAPRDLNEAAHFGAQCYAAKFPRPEQFRAIVREAAAMAAGGSSFNLPCNLMLSTPHSV